MNHLEFVYFFDDLGRRVGRLCYPKSSLRADTCVRGSYDLAANASPCVIATFFLVLAYDLGQSLPLEALYERDPGAFFATVSFFL